MTDSDSPKESCGLFGIYGMADCASVIYRGLFSLQHRGQEGAGIVVSDGENVRSAKGLGLVSDVFAKNSFEALKGFMGIGHVRYSTTGSTKLYNVQPLIAECVDGIWAIAHNGNLTNAEQLRRMYQDAGAIFQTSTDSEVLIHLLADPMYRTRPRRVGRALGELQGAYSFLIMTKNCVIAARDAHGFRPLSIGRIGEAYVVASETCAFADTGATYVRDVEPGELIIIDETGLHSSYFAEHDGPSAQCVFEMVYFARPDSIVFGSNVHMTRMKYGMRLAEEHPVEADIVVPVPDSGNSAALGFSRKSGIPFDFGFIRNHYVGRTFIMPEAAARSAGADLKLAVVPEVVKGKRVVVVDDSIVRGTTVRRRVKLLRDAGAKEIHVRISCPPTSYPCFFGIDFPTQEELVAGKKSVEDIRKYIESDTLGYLSVEGLLSPFKNPRDFCAACFTGEYPVNIGGVHSKKAMEKHGANLQLDL